MKDSAFRASLFASSLPLLLALVGACGPASRGSATGPQSGGLGGSSGGVGGSAPGGASAGGAVVPGNSAALPVGLPVGPGAGDLPPPSGSGANLRVLPWAGFSSAVSYTIDDTQPSLFEHWTELKASGVRMTLYANSSSNWIAGYDATLQDAIAEGYEIGNHTVNHCHADLTGCTTNLGSLDAEIDQCSTYIKTRLGQADVWTFAFPFGEVAYEPYSKSRFMLARGVGSGSVGASDRSDPFNLPIIAAAGGEATSVFTGQIDAVSAKGRWLIFLFHSILPTTQNWYAGVEIANITGSIEYAKGLGNVWIDSVANIGSYWLGQRSIETAASTTTGEQITWTWTVPALFPKERSVRVTVDGGTLSQGGEPLVWDAHGYYEVSLDSGSLTWSP